jgi:hypothetical protein
VTSYVFKHQIVESGERVEIPDNARDINMQHEFRGGKLMCHVSWLEKEGDSVI